MKAVIYQHERHEGLAQLEAPLRENGFQLLPRFRDARHEDAQAELLVVLGGPMAVYEADQHPFLGHEQAVIAERLAADRPCLGLCLGSQLMAAAAGARVMSGKNGFEIGAAAVRWTKAAQTDPVIAGVRSETAVGHWHGDTFEPVPGSVLLASTARYTQQAFRLGRSYAFQFHPELAAADLDGWLTHEAGALSARGMDVKALRAGLKKLEAAEGELHELRHRLARHFRDAV